MTTPQSAQRLMPSTVEGFQQLLLDNLYHTHGQAVQSADKHDAYMALAYSVRDYLIDRWRRTTEAHYQANPKFVYYSMFKLVFWDIQICCSFR